jgi:hypothetical protein
MENPFQPSPIGLPKFENSSTTAKTSLEVSTANVVQYKIAALIFRQGRKRLRTVRPQKTVNQLLLVRTILGPRQFVDGTQPLGSAA